MGVVHGGGWFIRSSHVALIYSPKPRIYFIHYAFPGAEASAPAGEALLCADPHTALSSSSSSSHPPEAGGYRAVAF